MSSLLSNTRVDPRSVRCAQEGKIKSLAQLESYLAEHEGVDVAERKHQKETVAGKSKVGLMQAAAGAGSSSAGASNRKSTMAAAGRQKARDAMAGRSLASEDSMGDPSELSEGSKKPGGKRVTLAGTPRDPAGTPRSDSPRDGPQPTHTSYL